MILDTVSVVVRNDLIGTDETYSDVYWKATLLPEYVFYGHGSSADAQKATIQAEDLNDKHKNSCRYYSAVRMDREDAIKEGLL